jgi:hypothetical protein
MHTTIAIPADVSVQSLAKALAALGLAASAQRGRMLTFDYAPARAATVEKRCTEAGCSREAAIRQQDRPLCAVHWLAQGRPGGIHE